MVKNARNPLRYALTDQERARVFADVILPFELRNLHKAKHPAVRYIGAQPGAGKSTWQSQIMTALQEIDGQRTSIEINNDRYRVHHPRYIELRERDEVMASFYTNEDCAYWIDRALNVAFEQRPHVLLESSLRRPEVVLATIKRAHEHGFSSALDIIVAHEFESRLSIAQRYLDSVEGEGRGRYVLRSTHDESYHRLPDILLQLAAPKGGFEVITVYARTGKLLYRHFRGDDDPQELKKAYLTARAIPNQSYNQLLMTTNRQIERATWFERQVCLDDLIMLRHDVEENKW